MTKPMASKYFSVSEVACRCGCGMLPTKATLDKADDLRHAWGAPLYCQSGARCPKWNKKIGGADDSDHLRGEALDLRVAAKDRRDFVELAFDHNWPAIGVYRTFIHVGIRPIYTLWPGKY